MKILSFVFLALLICGCRDRQKAKQPSQDTEQPKTNLSKRIYIDMVGELRFRRSYAGHENMSGKEYRKLLRSKPEYYSASKPDSFLLKRFKELGYLNEGYDLINEKLASFRIFNIEKPDTTLEVTGELNKKISCQIKKSDSEYQFDLLVASGRDSTLYKIKYKFILPGLQLRTQDIAPGGFEEVILLDEYYIMNGDNFDFYIYEIKYN